MFTFSVQPDPEAGIHGSQIDLVIKRADRVTNLTMITPFGIIPNAYAGNFESVLTADDLFRCEHVRFYGNAKAQDIAHVRKLERAWAV